MSAHVAQNPHNQARHNTPAAIQQREHETLEAIKRFHAEQAAANLAKPRWRLPERGEQ